MSTISTPNCIRNNQDQSENTWASSILLRSINLANNEEAQKNQQEDLKSPVVTVTSRPIEGPAMTGLARASSDRIKTVDEEEILPPVGLALSHRSVSVPSARDSQCRDSHIIIPTSDSITALRPIKVLSLDLADQWRDARWSISSLPARRNGPFSPKAGSFMTSPRMRGKNMKSYLSSSVHLKNVLPKSDFDFFWTSVSESEEHLFKYIFRLLQELINYINHSSIPGVLNKSSKFESKMNPRLLLSTLGFVVLRFCHKLKNRSSVKAASQVSGNKEWVQLHQIVSLWYNKSVDIQKQVKEGKELPAAVNQVVNDWLSPAIHRGSPIEQVQKEEERKFLRGLVTAAKNSSERLTGCSDMVVWPYLLGAIKNDNNFQIIFDALCSSCKSWGQEFSSIKVARWGESNGVSENKNAESINSLLSLLHMLSTIITHRRIDRAQCMQAMEAVIPFYSWPKPVGSQALKVLEMIQSEQQTAGYSIVKRYLEEIWCPRVLYEKPYQPLFYIINEKLRQHMTWASIIGIDPLDDRAIWGFEMSEAAMALFLLGTLRYVGGKEIGEKVKNALYWTPREELRRHWLSLTEILSHARMQETKDGGERETFGKEKMDTQDRLDKLHRDILQVSERPELSSSAEDAEQKHKDDFMEYLKEPYIPELPSIAHSALVINTDTSPNFPQKGAIASNVQVLPKNAISNSLNKLFERIKSLRCEASQPLKIRLVATGGADTLHHLTMAFSSLMCEDKLPLGADRLYYQEIADNVELEVFLVPLAPCLLADYLARHDSWYRHHVYKPFRTHALVAPCVIKKARLTMKSERSTHTMVDFYQGIVNNYTREARHTLKVNIWACHAFKAHTRGHIASTNTPDMIIPYTTGVDFGEKVWERHREIKPLPYITLKWTRVDRSGSKIGLYTEPSTPYRSIRCAHIPIRQKETKVFSCASPARSYFEVSVKVAQKKIVRHAKNQSYFLRRPSAHAATLEATAKPGDEFHILVDDQLYGPFIKVKLVPLRLDKSLSGSNNSPQVYIKLRTFLEIYDPLVK